jgi:hypothetical protein
MISTTKGWGGARAEPSKGSVRYSVDGGRRGRTGVVVLLDLLERVFSVRLQAASESNAQQ